MANKILSDFFYGNIIPNEKTIDPTSDYSRKIAALVSEEDTLRTMLNSDAVRQLDKMLRMQGDVTGMTAEEYFIEGFRTGFRFALAVLYDDDLPSQ